MNSLKRILTFVGFMAIGVIAILLILMGGQMGSEWASVNTPNQQAQIVAEVRLLNVQPAEADTTLKLAQADAAVRNSQAEMLKAQAIKEQADASANLAYAQKIKEIQGFVVTLFIVGGIGLVGLILLRGVKRG